MLRRIVDVARMAPSVHNTQPWSWHATGTTLELWADRSRSLPASDPLGRNLVISCGTALHHALIAAEAEGAATTVEHLPEGADSDLLARIEVETAGVPPTPAALARLAAIGNRRTDRRRFTGWPVPEENLEHLAGAGREWGSAVLAVSEPAMRVAVEELLEEARRRQLADPRIAEETESWIDHGPDDGVPAAVLPHLQGARGERPIRFESGLAPEGVEAVIHGTDGILVVSTPDDGPLSWLHAGESLSALWLRAAAAGLSLVPLSQAVEVQRTRLGLEQLLAPPARVPQVLARVGWQEIGRDDLPRTPRRSLDDVLSSAD
jgi:nitroreductase